MVQQKVPPVASGYRLNLECPNSKTPEINNNRTHPNSKIYHKRFCDPSSEVPKSSETETSKKSKKLS